MTHEELLHGRPARISTRSTNHMWRGFARYGTQPACTSQPPVLRARPRERPRRRTVGPGRTDSSYRSRSIFVIRRRSKRNTNPAPWGARRDAGRTRPRDRLARPCERSERGPYARTTRRYPPARGVPPGQAGAGSGDVEPTPRSNSKHVRQSSMTSINTIQTRQKLATFLTPET